MVVGTSGPVSRITWTGGFNIGATETVNFRSTIPSHTFFNVDSTGALSNVLGNITTTGTGISVYLINPMGVTIGPNAAINVSGSFGIAGAHAFSTIRPANSIVTIQENATINANKIEIISNNQIILGNSVSNIGPSLSATGTFSYDGSIYIATLIPTASITVPPPSGFNIATSASTLTKSNGSIQSYGTSFTANNTINLNTSNLRLNNNNITSNTKIRIDLNRTTNPASSFIPDAGQYLDINNSSFTTPQTDIKFNSVNNNIAYTSFNPINPAGPSNLSISAINNKSLTMDNVSINMPAGNLNILTSPLYLNNSTLHGGQISIDNAIISSSNITSENGVTLSAPDYGVLEIQDSTVSNISNSGSTIVVSGPNININNSTFANSVGNINIEGQPDQTGDKPLFISSSNFTTGSAIAANNTIGRDVIIRNNDNININNTNITADSFVFIQSINNKLNLSNNIINSPYFIQAIADSNLNSNNSIYNITPAFLPVSSIGLLSYNGSVTSNSDTFSAGYLELNAGWGGHNSK